MKIGIIGTGRMGSGLGRIWASRGHQIYFGSREPARAANLARLIGPAATGGSQRQAAQFGEALLLATPWSASLATMTALADLLAGKIVIDMTNPLQDGRLILGHTTSAAEELARLAPGARLVKAFNGIHFATLDQPLFDGQIADVFYCGDDAAAKTTVAGLIDDAGFVPVDCGPLANARLLEPLAMLWIQLAFREGLGTDFAFKLIRR